MLWTIKKFLVGNIMKFFVAYIKMHQNTKIS